MDIENFKLFLKNKFIIINYPTGCFGGFLGTLLCTAEKNNLLIENLIGVKQNTFQKNGSSHQNIKECILNFHNNDHFSSWVHLSYQQKLEYLYDNCLVKNCNKNTYFLLLICCPNHSEKLIQFFDENKIITIKPDKDHYEILKNLIFFKGFENYEKGLYFKRFKKKINFKKNENKIKEHISKKAARFFINDVDYNQKYLYNLQSFFSKESFIFLIKQIEKQLNLVLDYDVIEKTYEVFHSLNKIYFLDEFNQKFQNDKIIETNL